MIFVNFKQPILDILFNPKNNSVRQEQVWMLVNVDNPIDTKRLQD